MNSQRTHWPSILILLCLVIAMLFLLMVGFFMGVNSLVDLIANRGIPATDMIVAATCFFEFLILGVCCWFVLQRALGRESAFAPVKIPFSRWHVILIVGFIALAVVIGGFAANSEISWVSWLILPISTLFVVVPPIWLVLGIGSRGLDPGPRWRFAAILGTGMTIGPLLMIGLEIVILAAGVILWAFYVAVFSPELLSRLESLVLMANAATSEDAIINLVSPYLTNPFVIVSALGYVSIIVPLIEEAFKPLAVWVFAGKIESPSQGFVLGMVSGGAFALIESLNASADGSSGWPFIVSVRAGTSLLHMVLSGIVGWGIVSAFRDKKFGRLAGAYFSAVMIHALWNMCALGTGFSFLGEFTGQDGWIFKYLPAMIGGMIVLAIGVLVILFVTVHSQTDGDRK